MFRTTAPLIVIVLMMTNLMSHAQSTAAPSSQTENILTRQTELAKRFQTRAELTQGNVDQLLKTYPVINSTLQEMNPTQTPEMQKTMSISIKENTPYEGLRTALKDTNVLQRLDTVAKDNGYVDYSEYALMADYLYQIYISQQKTIVTVSDTEKDVSDASKIQNLSAFLNDGTEPSERRAKYQAQLSKIYKEFNISNETHDIFAKNYDALMLFFNPSS